MKIPFFSFYKEKINPSVLFKRLKFILREVGNGTADKGEGFRIRVRKFIRKLTQTEFLQFQPALQRQIRCRREGFQPAVNESGCLAQEPCVNITFDVLR